METFTETIRTQKQKDFWRESEKWQRFSPEVPSKSVDDLLSSVPPGTFDDAEEDNGQYRCYGKDPYHGMHEKSIECKSEKKAIVKKVNCKEGDSLEVDQVILEFM